MWMTNDLIFFLSFQYMWAMVQVYEYLARFTHILLESRKHIGVEICARLDRAIVMFKLLSTILPTINSCHVPNSRRNSSLPLP